MITEEKIKQCIDSGWFYTVENVIRYLNMMEDEEEDFNPNGEELTKGEVEDEATIKSGNSPILEER